MRGVVDMRLKRNRMQTIYHHNLIVTKDGEGVPVKSYSAGKSLDAIVWPATSKLQIEQYGNEIHRVKNVKLDGKYEVSYDDALGIELFKINGVLLKENDGIRIHSKEKPDYKIVSIKPYEHLLLEVKKL